MKYLILKTVAVIAILGYLFSSRKLILFLNSMNPFQGLLFYYLQLFVTLELLQAFGLVIGGVKMTSLTQTFGELMMVFAFFILVAQESECVAHVVGEKDYPVVYTQSEDGAVFYLWTRYVTSDYETARILTFVVTPVILMALGLYLTGGAKVRREMLMG